jgi:tRNA (guanine-N7-)-methyltransferase
MRVRTHTNPFNYHERQERIDFKTIWPEFNGTLDYEIGFGRGVFLRNWAEKYPERYIVGAEIRKSVTDILKGRVEKAGLNNTHLIHGNGEIILEDCFEDESLDTIFVFHPDPWFKKRHHKRRVVRPKFLEIAHKKLKKNGVIHVSTDVTPLWEGMVETFEADPNFVLDKDHSFWKDDYTSHWHEFGQRDGRDLNIGTFRKLS